MTGGSFLPTPAAAEYEVDDAELGQSSGSHSVQWVGTPGVKGPQWAKLPLLTVGVLGTQVVWSIEMGYASPFLLELGLSKSWMSLVFVAGPLSGLIVQPLIGAYADRSRSRFGRRRPFMLAGCGIAVCAMMLLAWSREVSNLFGAGNWGAIACAVLSIYLIDFSINAVMSTDRALIVDTLPPQQQEAANAWAGRMCGIGGVAGFFVGNVDLTHVLRWLGNTQLQILSLLTSVMLALAHTSTSWAVTERVLLRDDRPQSRAGLLSAVRSIWQNMFTLPRSIRAICFIQFFASLGWYPVLFWTSIWVSDIYKRNNAQGDKPSEAYDADAVRAGSRALFLQALISLAISAGAPFLVAESGLQPKILTTAYQSLSTGDGSDTPNSTQWKRDDEARSRLSIPERAAAGFASAIRAVRTGSAWALPIRGLTVVKLWFIAQCVFACCMLATWFTGTVGGAYFVIGVTGFSWALAQWAPFALLAELVLIDPSVERHPRGLTSGSTEVLFSSEMEAQPSSSSSMMHSRSHTRNPSHETLEDDPRHPLSRLVIPGASPPPRTLALGADDTADLDTTVVLRHSDESDASARSGYTSPASTPATPGGEGPSTADKAGLILGIHNVFVVLPQFVITAVSAIIFHFMEASDVPPATSPSVPEAPDTGLPGDSTGGSSNKEAVGLVFRIGGTSAAFGAYLTYRLARRWRRGEV